MGMQGSHPGRAVGRLCPAMPGSPGEELEPTESRGHGWAASGLSGPPPSPETGGLQVSAYMTGVGTSEGRRARKEERKRQMLPSPRVLPAFFTVSPLSGRSSDALLSFPAGGQACPSPKERLLFRKSAVRSLKWEGLLGLSSESVIIIAVVIVRGGFEHSTADRDPPGLDDQPKDTLVVQPPPTPVYPVTLKPIPDVRSHATIPLCSPHIKSEYFRLSG